MLNIRFKYNKDSKFYYTKDEDFGLDRATDQNLILAESLEKFNEFSWTFKHKYNVLGKICLEKDEQNKTFLLVICNCEITFSELNRFVNNNFEILNTLESHYYCNFKNKFVKKVPNVQVFLSQNDFEKFLNILGEYKFILKYLLNDVNLGHKKSYLKNFNSIKPIVKNIQDIPNAWEIIELFWESKGIVV